MRDELDLGCVPAEESCESVGQNEDKAYAECQAYVRQLRRMFPEPGSRPGHYRTSGYFKIKRNPHDFGVYLSVIAVYDDADEDEVKWAFNAENNLPLQWDDAARFDLATLGFPLQETA